MKKQTARVSSVLFGLSLIFLGLGNLNAQDDPPVLIEHISCPDGDSYDCYKKGSMTFYKGEGLTIITIHEPL